MLRRPDLGPHRPHRRYSAQTVPGKLHVRCQPAFRQGLADTGSTIRTGGFGRQRSTLIHAAVGERDSHPELFQGEGGQPAGVLGEVPDELGGGGRRTDSELVVLQAARVLEVRFT